LIAVPHTVPSDGSWLVDRRGNHACDQHLHRVHHNRCGHELDAFGGGEVISGYLSFIALAFD
jgi:hypothetical protein